MANDVSVKTKTKKVSNSKTKTQSDEKEKLKKQKSQASVKAKAEQEKNKKKIEEAKAKAEEEKKKDYSEEIKFAKSVVNQVSKTKKGPGFLVGILIGIVIGFLLATFLGFGSIKNSITGQVNEGKETVDEVIDEHFTGYTALDFKNVVLGAAVEHQELIVMEQPLEVETEITKAGLGNLTIFSKVKNVTYAGTGVYTVDMSNIDEQHIDVDMNNKIVKIKIPHTVLQYVNLDVENIQFEDTEKGLLALGDLSLTAEQTNSIEQSVRNSMKERLDSEDLYAEADEFAILKTWQIFQPLISAVSPEFIVETVFE